MADKRISQLIERVDIANNDVLPIVASGATTTNKVTISTIQDWMQSNLDVGVTSVGLTMPSAFQVSGSPITTSGNINVTATGTASQYIRGDGTLADFPQGGGGGASVSYYLNGSVSQGTIGGIAYLEMNKTPILGAGTDFTISSDGYIASFITDAGDPALLQIPAGNWNFETYLQASSGGGTPTFYIELYKVDSGGTATLIASNSGTPELIAFGTTINPYFSALAVPQTTLALTDRLALRYYVSPSGRTITLHTENNTLCQIITTFTTGLTALNGLTAQVQNFATGTSGTNFGITSSGSIHTFNLPDASASARGVVTTGSQIFGGVKTFADGLSLPSAGGTNQASRFVNIGTIHQGSGGSNQIGFNNSNNIYFGKGLDNGGVIQWSNSAVRYYTLPNADGTIALTSDLGNYIQGVGDADFIPKFTAARTLANSAIRDTTSTVVISKNVSVDNGASQSINLTPASGGTTNRIETTGTLPLAIITSGTSITLAAGGVTPQITLASSGAVTFANKITINTPSDGIGILLNGRTSDNFSSIRFGANTGAGQYNAISANASSLDISSLGATPITFSTDTQGGGGTRMTISGTGAVTLTGALNGTSASFTNTVSVSNPSLWGVLELKGSSTIQGGQVDFYGASTRYATITGEYESANNGQIVFRNLRSNSLTTALTLASTGAATFSSNLTINGNDLDLNNGSVLHRITNDNTNLLIRADYTNSAANSTIQFSVDGNSPALTIGSSGAATFSSSVTAGDVSFFRKASGAAQQQIRLLTATNSFATEWAFGNSPSSLNLSAAYNNGSGWSSDLFTITTGGNVGIGTPSPSTYSIAPNLVVDSGANGGGITIKTGTTASTSNYGFIGFADGTSGNEQYRGYIQYSHNFSSEVDALQFGTSGERRMTITSGGNVGIGTASPSQSLNVVGNGRFEASSGNRYIEVASSTSSIQFGTDGSSQFIYGVGSFPMTFSTAGTERMRITSGGNVLIGIQNFADPSAADLRAGFISAQNNNSAQRCIQAWNQATSGDNKFIDFYTEAGNLRGSIDFNRGAGLTRYNTTSDANLKNIIGDSDKSKSIEILNTTKIREYSWKDDESEKVQIGVIAQELHETFKGAVSVGSHVEDLGTEDYRPWAVDKTAFTFHLIAGWQEHQRIIQELKAEIEALKSQING